MIRKINKPVKQCQQCSQEITQNHRGRPRVYCSAECRNAATQARAKTKKKLPGGVIHCPQCGEAFLRQENTQKQCCSLKCSHKYTRQEKVAKLRRIATETLTQSGSTELRAFVLELHAQGYGVKALSEAFGLAPNRIKYWVDEYERDAKGVWRRRRRARGASGTNATNPTPMGALESATTSAEWLSNLCKHTEPAPKSTHNLLSKLERVVLICGAMGAGRGADTLSLLIQSRLQMNPFDGTVFAFCSKSREKICYLYWDGTGFDVISRRRESGTYPWPSTKYGASMSVTGHDFARILSGKPLKIPQVYPTLLDWDCLKKAQEKASLKV